MASRGESETCGEVRRKVIWNPVSLFDVMFINLYTPVYIDYDHDQKGGFTSLGLYYIVIRLVCVIEVTTKYW